nr:NAC domain-containing protein [Tanacetum cinerariifolium]
MINQEKLNMDLQNGLNRLQEMMNLRNSNQDPLVDLYDLKGSDKEDNNIDSLTMEPSNTFLMGDKSEETSVYDDLECSMPINPLLPCTDVLGDTIVDIDLGEHLDTLSTGDREIDFNLSRDIEKLECLLADDPVLVPRVFDEPLCNSDSVPRSYDVTFSNPLFDFNDDYTLCYDNPLFDKEFEDISSLGPLESTPVIDESSLLVTPPPASKQLSLREVEVVYCYYHPHLTSGDRSDPESK